MDSCDNLPYYNSEFDVERLVGHGTRERKLFNVRRVLDSQDFDDTYKRIASVHLQNLMLEQMLDNDEDNKEPPKAPGPRKRAPTAGGPKKRAVAKKRASVEETPPSGGSSVS